MCVICKDSDRLERQPLLKIKKSNKMVKFILGVMLIASILCWMNYDLSNNHKANYSVTYVVYYPNSNDTIQTEILTSDIREIPEVKIHTDGSNYIDFNNRSIAPIKIIKYNKIK